MGLPITIARLRMVHLQFILNRVRARLAGWKGKLLTIAGRRVLVEVVLSSLPTFALTALRVPKKLIKEIDKVQRKFLWAQDAELAGGKCKVGWEKVCSPIDRGGLGILELSKFSTALRLRWLWHAWKHPDQTWVGMELPCDEGDRALFSATTKVTLGDGKTTKFWTCPWTGGATLKLAFPAVFKHSRRKNRTVCAALADDTWIKDLRHGNIMPLLHDILAMARAVRQAVMEARHGEPDEITWSLEASGCYTAKSAYKAQFHGSHTTNFRQIFWDTWAPGKLKIFSWLLYLDRLWCNDRLQRRGWDNNYFL